MSDPAKNPPETVSETDLLRISLAQSRIAKAAADLDAQQQRMGAPRLSLSLKYALGPTDQLNYDTGIITRG